jgi:predicted MFS family arabinose efflux permease
MQLAILILALSAFAINTTEFGIIGILPMIAKDLQIGIDQAGGLVSLFALTVAIAGPPLTLLTQRMDRKRLFIAILGIFTIANLIAAWAPNFGWLTIGRVIPAIGLPVFWAVATVTAAQLVTEKQRSRAVAMVFAGLSAATVLGVPLGAFLAEAFGWRFSFLGMAGLCLLGLAGISWGLPKVPPQAQVGIKNQMQVLRRPALWIGLLSNSLMLAGMFTPYTYLAEFLTQVTRLDGQWVSAILLLFGVMGLAGNWLAGQGLDRQPLRTTRLAMLGLAIVLALTLQAGASLPLMFPLLLLWGLVHTGCFVITQVRAISLAPEAPELAGSLNVSICNIGIALGSALGGWVIRTIEIRTIGGVGAILLLLAVSLTWYGGRQVRSTGNASTLSTRQPLH